MKATTLAKWLVDALGLTAIGTSVYLAYSTGAAASSNMMAYLVPSSGAVTIPFY